jgi:hypothetical protein
MIADPPPLDEEEAEDETAAVSSGAEAAPASAFSAKVSLHLGHLIAWWAMTIPQSGHFFIKQRPPVIPYQIDRDILQLKRVFFQHH